MQLRVEFLDSSLMCNDTEVIKSLLSRVQLTNFVYETADNLFISAEHVNIQPRSEGSQYYYWQTHVNCTLSEQDRRTADSFYNQNLRHLNGPSTYCNCLE